MKQPKSVTALEELGRIRLFRSFFMCDFLYSDIAATHGPTNIPDDPDRRIDSYANPRGYGSPPKSWVSRGWAARS